MLSCICPSACWMVNNKKERSISLCYVWFTCFIKRASRICYNETRRRPPILAFPIYSKQTTASQHCQTSRRHLPPCRLTNKSRCNLRSHKKSPQRFRGDCRQNTFPSVSLPVKQLRVLHCARFSV